jgi:hypothetical protein
MKYFLRLNGNPKLQCEVKHTTEISDSQIQVDDIGNFPEPTESVALELAELIGEDGQIYAMRRLITEDLPPIMVTTTTTLTLHLRLTITKGDGIRWSDKTAKKPC